MRCLREAHKESLLFTLLHSNNRRRHICSSLRLPFTLPYPPVGFTRFSLQIICPYLYLILKANSQATLHCSTWLRFHFVDRWSMISSFLFCVVVLSEEQKWKYIMWSSNKSARKCADVFQKRRVGEEWSVFTLGFLIMYILWIVGMHGCTVFTQCPFILH